MTKYASWIDQALAEMPWYSRLEYRLRTSRTAWRIEFAWGWLRDAAYWNFPDGEGEDPYLETLRTKRRVEQDDD